jgi:hypothetical protein
MIPHQDDKDDVVLWRASVGPREIKMAKPRSIDFVPPNRIMIQSGCAKMNLSCCGSLVSRKLMVVVSYVAVVPDVTISKLVQTPCGQAPSTGTQVSYYH